MSEKAAFDPKNHVVLGYWPENGGYAALMLNDAKLSRFVAAYGYDPDTREWAQGHYCGTAAEAWNMADPDCIKPSLRMSEAKEILSGFIDAEIPDAFVKELFEVVHRSFEWNGYDLSADREGWGAPDELKELLDEAWEEWRGEHE